MRMSICLLLVLYISMACGVFGLVCKTNTQQSPIKLNEKQAQLAGDVISLRTNVNDQVAFIVPDAAMLDMSQECDGVRMMVTTTMSSNTQFIVIPVAVIEDQAVPTAKKDASSNDDGMTLATFVSTVQLVHVDSGRQIGTPKCHNTNDVHCDSTKPVLLPFDFSILCPRKLKDYNTIWDQDAHSISPTSFDSVLKAKSGNEPAKVVVPDYSSNSEYNQPKSGFSTMSFRFPTLPEELTPEQVAQKYDTKQNIVKESVHSMKTMQESSNCAFDEKHEFIFEKLKPHHTMQHPDTNHTFEDTPHPSFEDVWYDMEGLKFLNESTGEMIYPSSGPSNDMSYVWKKLQAKKMKHVKQYTEEDVLEKLSKKKAENMVYYGMVIGLDNILYPRDSSKLRLVRERVMGPAWQNEDVKKTTLMREEVKQFKTSLGTRIKKMHITMQEEQGAKIDKQQVKPSLLPNSLRESSSHTQNESIVEDDDWVLDTMRIQGIQSLGVKDWTEEEQQKNAIETASRVVNELDVREKQLFVKTSLLQYLEKSVKQAESLEKNEKKRASIKSSDNTSNTSNNTNNHSKQMKTMNAANSLKQLPFLNDLGSTVGNVGLDNLMSDLTGTGLGGIFGGSAQAGLNLPDLAGNAAMWASNSMNGVTDKVAPDNEDKVSEIQGQFLNKYLRDMTATKASDPTLGSIAYSSKQVNNTAIVSLRMRPLGSGPLELVMPCKGYVTTEEIGEEWVVPDSQQQFSKKKKVQIMNTRIHDLGSKQVLTVQKNGQKQHMQARDMHRPSITFQGSLQSENVERHEMIDARDKDPTTQTASPQVRVAANMEKKFRVLSDRVNRVQKEIQQERQQFTSFPKSMKTMQFDSSQPCMQRVVPVTSLDGTVEDSIVECMPVSSACPTPVSMDNMGLLAVTRVPQNEVPTSSLFLAESMTTQNYDMDYASVNTYPFIIGQMALRNFSPFEQFLTAKSAKRQFSSFTFAWGIEIRPIVDIAQGDIPSIVFQPIENVLNAVVQAVVGLLETIIPGIGQLLPDINLPTIGISLLTNDFPFAFRGTHLHTEDSEVVVSYSITAPPQTHVLGRSIAHMGRSSVPFTMDVSRSVHVPAGVYGQTTGQVITYDYRVPGIYEGANLVNTEFIVDAI